MARIAVPRAAVLALCALTSGVNGERNGQTELTTLVPRQELQVHLREGGDYVLKEVTMKFTGAKGPRGGACTKSTLSMRIGPVQYADRKTVLWNGENTWTSVNWDVSLDNHPVGDTTMVVVNENRQCDISFSLEYVSYPSPWEVHRYHLEALESGGACCSLCPWMDCSTHGKFVNELADVILKRVDVTVHETFTDDGKDCPGIQEPSSEVAVYMNHPNEEEPRCRGPGNPSCSKRIMDGDRWSWFFSDTSRRDTKVLVANLNLHCEMKATVDIFVMRTPPTPVPPTAIPPRSCTDCEEEEKNGKKKRRSKRRRR